MISDKNLTILPTPRRVEFKVFLNVAYPYFGVQRDILSPAD